MKVQRNTAKYEYNQPYREYSRRTYQEDIIAFWLRQSEIYTSTALIFSENLRHKHEYLLRYTSSEYLPASEYYQSSFDTNFSGLVEKHPSPTTKRIVAMNKEKNKNNKKKHTLKYLKKTHMDGQFQALSPFPGCSLSSIYYSRMRTLD